MNRIYEVSSELARRFFFSPHGQVGIYDATRQHVVFEVDVGVRVAVQRLYDAGIYTWMSCQWEGPPTKKFPAYINPRGVCNLHEMAEIIGLRRGNYRVRNGVLWFCPFIYEEESDGR